MKIVHLTAGSGSFHCGTCLRDHALVKALTQLGHDVTMVPLYLPLVLEEPAEQTTCDAIYLGGVNVYLQQYFTPMRTTPWWIDRVFDSPMFLRLASRRVGMTSASQLGKLTLSLLHGESGPQHKEVSRLASHLAANCMPDVIMLSNALLIGVARQLKRATRAPVVCSLQGEDSFLDALSPPFREQCWNELAARATDIQAFIAVSEYHRQIMCKRLGIELGRCQVVHNGIDIAGFDPAPAPPLIPTIGYLARLCPAKGLHTLVDAFIRLRLRLPAARLHIIGAATAADQPYIDQQKRKLLDADAMGDVSIRTNVTLAEKQEFLRGLSVLSVPATYGESFGLYVIEALACGVPFVQPDHAAFPELMALTGGGKLCAPDDPEALTDALHELLTDEPQRLALGRRGRQAVLDRFTMQHMGRGVEGVLRQVDPHGL